MHPLRHLTALSGLVLVTATCVASASGWLTHVGTSGVSMEPTFTAGDLVILGRTGGYEVGEIVGYRAPGDETLVLHRIIGGDESGFVTRGDNNESTDPHRPAADEILGRELIHVPRIGGALRSPLVRGALFLTILGLLGVTAMNPKPVSTASATTKDRRGRIARLTWRGLLVLDVALIVGLALAHVSSTGPRGGPGSDEPTQTAELRYHADVEPSDTYPDGTISTGDPIFTSLVDRVDVSFRHTAEAPGSVLGTATIDVLLTTGSGWTSTRELVESTDIDSGRNELDTTVDIPKMRALINRVADATGVAPGSISITITASGEASLDGAAAEPFSVTMPFELNPASMTLANEPQDTSNGPAVSASSRLAKVADRDPDRRSLGDLRSPLLVAFLSAVAVTIVLWPAAIDDPREEDEGAPVTAGATSVQLPNTTARIQVADAKVLRAIAKSAARPLIAARGWEGVLTADALYWHEPADTTSPLHGRIIGNGAQDSPMCGSESTHF